MKKTILSLSLTLMLGAATELQAQQRPVYLDPNQPIEKRIDDAISRMTMPEKIAMIHAQSKFSSPGVKRLGIPEFRCDDGPHGVRAETQWDAWGEAGWTNDSVVAFPALTCLAATWNPDIALQYGDALGEEAVYREKHMILGPGVNIYRTPLGGRNFEYMGEDPYLSSRMCVPYIKGLQSHDVSSCVKHFVLNENEKDRHTTNVIVSDRALNEIYLPPFKAAVLEAKAWGVMGAYNLYKNYHNCHNPYLVADLLKNKWKFDGVLVSDWGGVHDTDEAVRYGCDMEYGTHTDGLDTSIPNAFERYYLAKPYRDAIVSGKYSEKELDDKVRRIMRLFYRTNMKAKREFGSLCSEAHYATSRKVADEGIVLLQNKNNLLPLNTAVVKRVLVVGENACTMMTLGGGSSKLKVQHEISPLQGLQEALKGKADVDYARGYKGISQISQHSSSNGGAKLSVNPEESRTPEALVAEATEKAKNADVVIFVGGLNKDRGNDCENHDRKGYELPYGQDKVVESLLNVNKNIVFVCISGNAAAMPWADRVPAIIQGWYLGSEAGRALAAVITGETNPSGKLPFTWGRTIDDYPAHKLDAYPGVKNEKTGYVDEEYKEGIYVGYRWSDKQKQRPLFAFGHGLSYTTFKFGKATADKKSMTADETITFSVDITNTGSRDGSEVAQLYISDLKCSLDRPVKELKAFKKVFVKAGETKRVDLTVDKSALCFYDDRINDWNAESGDFDALIGNASDNVLAKVRFTLK